MVADAERRREFVKNSIKFLRKNHFDGLDLDWEYPAFRDGGKPRDKDNYASLVQVRAPACPPINRPALPTARYRWSPRRNLGRSSRGSPPRREERGYFFLWRCQLGSSTSTRATMFLD